MAQQHEPAAVTTVAARNVGKMYRIYDRPEDRLKQMILARFGRRYGREFWALRGISFEVRRGQALGIIGRNGSGKSTLLQIIAGTLRPSEGEVALDGRVAALLELGTGFNPDFTGRENVTAAGAILGLTRAQIEERLPDILGFADIGDFVDQSVKTYSSGMVVRLAFAIQQAFEPDVLLVDEALSVGDVFFQQKCFTRVRQMRETGTSVVLVSHDLAAVQNLCDVALLLDRGCIQFIGPPEQCVSLYFAQMGGGRSGSALTAPRPRDRARDAPAGAAELLRHDILPRAQGRTGGRRLEVIAATFQNERDEHALTVRATATATISLFLRAHEAIPSPSAGIQLYDRMANLVFAAGTRQLNVPIGAMEGGEERTVRFRLTFDVQPGEYTFSVGCSEPSSQGPNLGLVHDRHEGLGPVTVYYDENQLWPFHGIARLPMTAAVE